MKLGVIGQVVATVMGQPRRLDEILAAYEADILGMLPRPTVSVPT